jgi:formylglycine-generating enzyme required for sulfatase activity
VGIKRTAVLTAVVAAVIAVGSAAWFELKADDTFRDCAECPEMVVIPPGRFRMGDVNGGGTKWEKPVHTVNIRYKFAVGKFEMTFSQWDACVSAGGCNGYSPKDRGWDRGMLATKITSAMR